MGEQTRLDALLLRYEELRAQNTLVSPEELCQDCPQLVAELKRQIQMLQSMEALLGSAASEAASTASRPNAAGLGDSARQPAEALCTGSRYQVLRLHAKGGLGEVHVARDEQLHRDVALKCLQTLHARNPHSRTRFLREAAITSRLEHPNIVPVHSIGQDADGCPFYAMRFIQGQTLQEAIRQFHAMEGQGRTPGDRHLALRQLLSRFVAVCNTVAYAHSKGIVHRDLKPENIMLGPYGETLVVDWGLAKEIEPREGEGAPPTEAAVFAAMGAPTLASSGAPTQTGDVIGTPTYMSPEQAEGRWDLVGPASDVYSLGVTLYTLLVGQSPFQGRQLGELLEKVKRGEFPPPRQRKKDIPRALEAVCLKAMARQPDQRYATALAIAADLEHWLADEPIGAWREPWTVRVRRWLGRHRMLVSTAAATVLVATVSLAVATGLLTAANQRERQAKNREKHNYLLARRAVDEFLKNMARDPRLREHDLEGLRRDLLQAAANFCDEFVRESSNDPDVLAEQGRVCQQLGFITQEIASKNQAIELYQQAVNIFDRLAQANPSVPPYRQGLAQSRYSLGMVYLTTGRPVEAEEELGQSLELRDQLLQEQPNDSEYQKDLAQSHAGLGKLQSYRKQLKEAESSYTKALGFQMKLVQADPTVSTYQMNLADTHLNLGSLYFDGRRPKESEEQIGQSLVLWEGLAEAEPSNPDYQSRLANVHKNLGVLYQSTGRLKQAEFSYQKAMTIRAKLAREHPTISDYRSSLARSYHELGALYHDTGRLAEAEAIYRQSLEINERLARDHPDVPLYAVDHGRNYGRLGHLMKGQNPQAALEWFDQAVRIHEAVCRQHPEHTDGRVFLSYDHWGRAQALTALERSAEALEDWDRALQLDNGRNRAERRVGRAGTLARIGSHARAVDEVEKGIEEGKPMGSKLYDAACVYSRCSLAVRHDEELPSTEQGRLTEHYAVRALDLLTKARGAGYFTSPARIKQMESDPDLESVRSRADYQKFAQELKERQTTQAK
jgi:tetratricopeptide (TPR) repeat protein